MHDGEEREASQFPEHMAAAAELLELAYQVMDARAELQRVERRPGGLITEDIVRLQHGQQRLRRLQAAVESVRAAWKADHVRGEVLAELDRIEQVTREARSRAGVTGAPQEGGSVQ